jgi:hypothetical protein
VAKACGADGEGEELGNAPFEKGKALLGSEPLGNDIECAVCRAWAPQESNGATTRKEWCHKAGDHEVIFAVERAPHELLV